uniref:Annexin n=1 Tax=Seriola lalandi dorsalis TaxID=1841481 RepID=A0A3B4WD93_SERLL
IAAIEIKIARGTIKDKANFKVEEDVAALRKAMEGLGKLMSNHYQPISEKHVKHLSVLVSLFCVVLFFIGTTEKTLIEVLTQRSNAQRQLIAKAYEKGTGRKLVADLEGDTHGDFEDLLVALVTPPAVYDCHEVIKAIKVRLCVQLSAA